MTRVWTAKIISYPFNYICRPVLTPVDIGKQISQQNRPRFPLIKKFTPTRIPSPVWNATIKDRHVSIPVLPSQKSRKENEKQKAQRPHDAIYTSNRPPLHLPKSRTIGILSNFTTSFSRASLSLDDCRQASITATHPVKVTTCDPENIIILASTSSMHQIHASKMNSYWCGRFQALCDRFHDENFLVNSEAAQQYATDDSDSSSLSSTPTPNSKEIPGSKLRPSKAGGGNTYPQGRISRSKDEEHDKRSSRAFHHLQSLCATNEAKKSLWEFQLHFARIERKPHLLPKGGKMEDGRGGWLGRVGKAMAWGNSTGLGPHTSVGMGKRKNSMVDFLDSQ